MIIMGVGGTDLFHYCFLQQFAFVNGFGLEKNIPSEVIHPPHSSTFFVVVAKFHAEFAF